jgi:secreted Zn-dependent insulinase-like peptidase
MLKFQGVYCFRVIVQSDKRDAKYLDQRIRRMLGVQDDEGDDLPAEVKEEKAEGEGAAEAYMSLRQKLASQTEEQFKDNVNAVVAKKLEKDKTPWQEATRFWGEISSSAYLFDRKQIEADVLKTLELREVLAFYDTYIGTGAPSRRLFSGQVFGEGHEVPAAEATIGNAKLVQVDDADSFKRSMPLFPAMELFKHTSE